MLIGAESIYSIITAYRLVWISGRFGGGKTSLAFLLSRYYLERGYRLVTNVHTVWADSLDSVYLRDGKLRAVLLLDEGGLWLSSEHAKALAAYSAKLDLVFLVPSFFPPPAAFRVVRVSVLWTLRHIGVPLTVYRWTVSSGASSDSGRFVWLLPEWDGVYGVYSRFDPSGELDDIVEWMSVQVSSFRALHGRSSIRSFSSCESESVDVEDTWSRISERLSSLYRRRW